MLYNIIKHHNITFKIEKKTPKENNPQIVLDIMSEAYLIKFITNILEPSKTILYNDIVQIHNYLTYIINNIKIENKQTIKI